MPIERAGIAALVPHAGAMVLLDRVDSWDAVCIACATLSHRADDNPLRRDGRLGVLCGIEYAAQAMAVHGALLAGAAAGSRGGLLASLRDLVSHADRLDDLPGPLAVIAIRLHGEADRVIYRFELAHDGRLLLEGRAAVVLT